MSEEEQLGGKKPTLRIGDYLFWDIDDDKESFILLHSITGETGVFKKDEFLPYVSAFFGLSF